MTTPFTLAHLSDVHLGPLPPFALRHINVKRALGWLNWQRKRRHVHRADALALVVADLQAAAPDHIAVTGDLVNIALPGEYEAAAAWLAGLGPPEQVSVVPGNHDIYTRLGADPGVARWRAYMQSDAWGRELGGAPVGFPYVRQAGPMALVGVNSAVPTPPFVAAGEVGGPQRKALAAILDRLGAAGVFRTVLIHHPPLPGQAPARRGLADAPALERVLETHGAELVLHGHNHRDMLEWRAWRAGRFPVVGIASGSAAKPHREEQPARYNLIRLEPQDWDGLDDGGGWWLTIVTRGLDTATGTVAELSRRRLPVGGPQASALAAGGDARRGPTQRPMDYSSDYPD